MTRTLDDPRSRIERDARTAKSLVQIAGLLRDLTAEVRELSEIVHKMAVLMASKEDSRPEAR